MKKYYIYISKNTTKINTSDERLQLSYYNNNNFPFLYSAYHIHEWRLYALEALLPQL